MKPNTILDHLATWQADAKHERTHGGYGTGWPTIDHALERPLRPGELVVIGARPGVGKSYLGAEICRYNLQRARDGKLVRVGMLSLEMPGSDVAERAAAIALNEKPRDLRRIISEPDAPDAQLIANDHPWLLRFLIDEERRNADDLIPAIRSLGTPPIILIDYLGLIASGPGPEYERISKAVLECKLAAKETRTLVILLAQLRRANDAPVSQGDDTIPPRMSDLKGSGDIEAHADRILGAWRDADDRRILHLRILKNRHGSGTGTTVPLLQAPSGALREYDQRNHT